MSRRQVDPLDTSLLFDVFALNQAVGRLLADSMRDAPLTPSEYAIYSAVFELEAASPTVIAARLGMRLTTFMDQLRVLERRGHAQRLPHPTDRRSYRVVLTADGLAAHREANRSFEAGAAALAVALGDDEAAAKGALERMRTAADRARSRLEGPAATPRFAGRAG